MANLNFLFLESSSLNNYWASLDHIYAFGNNFFTGSCIASKAKALKKNHFFPFLELALWESPDHNYAVLNFCGNIYTYFLSENANFAIFLSFCGYGRFIPLYFCHHIFSGVSILITVFLFLKVEKKKNWFSVQSFFLCKKFLKPFSDAWP